MQRQELAGAAGIVTVELAEEGQFAVVGNVPGQAGRQVETLVVHMLDNGATVTAGTAETVEKATFIVDLAGAVEADLLVVVVTDLHLHFMAAFGLRTAADGIHQAAGRGLAIHCRGRAAQHGDAFQVPGFQFGHGVAALGQWQAVEHLDRFETADFHPVGAAVAAVAAGDDTRHIAHGVIEVLHLAVLHLLAGGDGDRAWGFQQRRVGLGAGRGAVGQVTAGWAPGGLGGLFAGGDGDVRQCHCRFCSGGQAVGAAIAALQLQASATQGLIEGFDGFVVAVDRCRAFARGQGRVDAQGHAGLAGDLVERGRQRAGGQLVNLSVGQPGMAGKGNGQGQQRVAERGRVEGHCERLLRVNVSQCPFAEAGKKSDRGGENYFSAGTTRVHQGLSCSVRTGRLSATAASALSLSCNGKLPLMRRSARLGSRLR